MFPKHPHKNFLSLSISLACLSERELAEAFQELFGFLSLYIPLRKAGKCVSAFRGNSIVCPCSGILDLGAKRGWPHRRWWWNRRRLFPVSSYG